MDAVFDAHYRVVQHAFATQEGGDPLDIAVRPNGEVDYIFARDHLLVALEDPNTDLPDSELVRSDRNIANVLAGLPGIRFVERRGRVAVLAVDRLEGGFLRVPDAVTLLEDRLRGTVEVDGPVPVVSPDHLVHVERLCSAIEPELPSGMVRPWPEQRPCDPDELAVRVALVDSGFIHPLPPELDWLTGVDGEDDALVPIPGGVLIPPFAGHGTFVAGVARCQAPRAVIRVGDELNICGASLESKLAHKVDQMIKDFDPSVVNISSGAYTRRSRALLSFADFEVRHPEVVVVCAAGNDRTDLPLYPAAFDWAVAVGALGPDQENRAWFSNFGPHVDVFTLGEGHVNAFPTGEYRYHEPPKVPAQQKFRYPLARWDGTSFAAPVISGMIAAGVRPGRTAMQVKDDLLAAAAFDPVVGGRVIKVPGVTC